ncbi:VQ motif containing protein [Trema orientale]|uniref:VQ motif containing protein n=1 Tax=Trema orientale TaxID=63057 RepID=A0A2P5G1W3_TREOI|nr:VQ motif containing protein [Trema orientale]
MDSGNSGSMQSSSTGDEEYDSRPESIPGNFLNPNSSTTTHFIGSSDSHHHFQNHQQPTLFFDHLSSHNNYLQALSTTTCTTTTTNQPQPISNPNFLLNLDHSSTTTTTTTTNVGSRSSGLHLRSEPNTSTTYQLGNVPPGPPSSSSSHHALTGGSQFPGRPSSSGRSSKKRTRASRRAPTTVLTTDTSNFRAMVQEFTGIPAPPFSSGGYATSFSRCRLDLFGGSGMPDHLYPLRPSAQKPQTSPFLSSSNAPLFGNSVAMVDARTSSNVASNNVYLSGTPPSLVNYQTSVSDHQGLITKQPRNVGGLNVQNPIMGFQSLNPEHLINPSINVAGFGTKAQGNLALTTNSFEEMNAGQGYRGGTTSNQTGLEGHGMLPLRRGDDIWRDDNNANVSACKLNYVAASSEFHPAEKALEMNVSTRGEGTVDSWIFPSE